MRYRRAVEKIRILAEACQDFSKRYPSDEPVILEAYVFGDVLRGADPLEDVEVALVLNMPPDEVIWGSTPHGTPWLADYLRLSKGVLQALAEGRFDDLPQVTSSPEVRREQAAGELEAALGRLRSVHASYWDYDWRRDNRGGGRYPEHELWEAVEGYLDLLDASQQ